MKLTTILLVSALTGSAFSAPAIGASKNNCAEIADLAGSMMRNRQAGIDMSEMIAIVAKSGVGELVTPIVIAAYEQPRFDTPSYQKKAITDFKNEVMLACMKGVK